MGQIIYPSYTIKKSVAIFGNRLELLEYEAAYRLLSEIIAASDDSQWKVCKVFLDELISLVIPLQ